MLRQLSSRYALEIQRLEKQKSILDHDLAGPNHRSMVIPKSSRFHHPRLSKTQAMIEKLKVEKMALAKELSHEGARAYTMSHLQKNSRSHPSILAQNAAVQRRVAHPDAIKQENDLKHLLHLQDILEEKFSAFDQQDDPAVQGVLAEHFVKNPVFFTYLFVSGSELTSLVSRVSLGVFRSRLKMYLVRLPYRHLPPR